MTSTASPLAAPALPALAVGAAAPSFEELLGTDGRRHGFCGLRRERPRRARLLVEPLSDGEGLRGADERAPDATRDRAASSSSPSIRTIRISIPTRLSADGRARGRGRLRLSVPGRPRPARGQGVRGRPARSMSSCSTASGACATRAASTIRGSPERVTTPRSPERHRGPARGTRGRGPDHASVRLQPRSGVR